LKIITDDSVFKSLKYFFLSYVTVIRGGKMKNALVFSRQGSQKLNMMRDFYEDYKSKNSFN